MNSNSDAEVVADNMYRYFGKEWGNKIRDALCQRPDTAQNRVSLLLVDAYMCGVRDGEGFGLRTIARDVVSGRL